MCVGLLQFHTSVALIPYSSCTKDIKILHNLVLTCTNVVYYLTMSAVHLCAYAVYVCVLVCDRSVVCSIKQGIWSCIIYTH